VVGLYLWKGKVSAGIFLIKITPEALRSHLLDDWFFAGKFA